MKDSLTSQNSFIFDRNWQKVNPNNEPTVSLDNAKLFLKLVGEDYDRLRRISQTNSEDMADSRVMDRIELFLFKYIQEKELAVSSKSSSLPSIQKAPLQKAPSLQKTPYRLSLSDCLEVWRWLSEDSTSYRLKEVAFDESMNVNEFELGSSVEGGVEVRKSVDYSSKNKRVFGQLSLQEQETVLKKSLEMVHLYYHQLKIIFTHYCRFPIENEHKRTATFDDVSHSLHTLTINRFMLFCRDFDILKTLEFKRRTEHNPSMSKDFLMKAFKKDAHHQKYMALDTFLITLVHIALKIHENFDPRSYMHIELFLSSLKVKYYEEFVAKLDSLHIKYTPTDFYNCYRHIFDRQSIRKKKEGKKHSHTNYASHQYLPTHHYSPKDYPGTIRLNKEGTIRLNQSIGPHQQPMESSIYRSHHSVPSLLLEGKKGLQRRKVSVPALPSLQENRFFKPLEHNHHLNSYNRYLQRVEDTSSVFKNRITGYSNINALKTKGFHTNPNPEAVSKETLDHLLAKKTVEHQDRQSHLSHNRLQSDLLPQDNVEQLNELNYAARAQSNATRVQHKDIQTDESASHMASSKLSGLTSKGLLRRQQRKEALQSLRQKIDVKEDDQLLKKHLVGEQHRHQETPIHNP